MQVLQILNMLRLHGTIELVNMIHRTRINVQIILFNINYSICSPKRVPLVKKKNGQKSPLLIDGCIK